MISLQGIYPVLEKLPYCLTARPCSPSAEGGFPCFPVSIAILCKKSRHGSPKCLTMAFTSGGRKLWRRGWYCNSSSSFTSGAQPFIHRCRVLSALLRDTCGL